MKKLVQVIFFILVGCNIVHAQFNELGYKNLKLGMSVSDAKKIVKISNPAADRFVDVKYDGVDISLLFSEEGNKLILRQIYAESNNAKVEGVTAPLIGQPLKAVKSLLGTKMVEIEDFIYAYHRNKAAKENHKTVCILRFNSNSQKLEGITSEYSFNPDDFSDFEQ